MLDLTTYLPKLKGFEGNIGYMYLDSATPPKVTVGVGEMLPNAAAAQKLAFVRRPDPAAKPPVLPGAATADEIKADFDNVAKQAGGKIASYYQQFTKLDLPQSVIDSTVNDEIFHFKVGLIASFPDFESYPSEVCAALFDMAYNLGMDGLTSKFPTFCKAVKAKDWATAAKECHRTGPPDDRNDWTKAQFDKVAADVAAAAAAAAAAAKATPAP
jgi:GH24 family phage-related lysozyme (muramidase)